jgi:hypothetical protein
VVILATVGALLGLRIGLTAKYVEGAEPNDVSVPVILFLVVAAVLAAAVAKMEPQVAGVLLVFAAFGGFIAFWNWWSWVTPGVLFSTGAYLAWRAGRILPV